MKPKELIADAPFPPGHKRESLLHLCLFLRYLADHVYMAELESGAHLTDVIDAKTWFREMAQAAREEAQKPGGLSPSLRLEMGQERTCPICNHEHQGREECGAYLSELRFCKCTHRLEAALR